MARHTLLKTKAEAAALNNLLPSATAFHLPARKYSTTLSGKKDGTG
jgi:hypothetical protein